MTENNFLLEQIRNLLGVFKRSKGDKKKTEPDDKKKILSLWTDPDISPDILNNITKHNRSNNVMLQMTSKKVKEKMDKSTPIQFRLTRSFMQLNNNEVGLSNVLTQLEKQSRNFNIVSIEMSRCLFNLLPEEDIERIAEVLENCPNLE